ncbi:putative Transcriptional regulator [Vibrio harveyi]|uniref:winged helix-turn-helix domain-containing protein n=1 Tax=Vibrio harveyi TaxID=669 RepID=UPI002AD9B925|nr:winged helix-turn-helix domain-containing protein [Vibrio harveyi]CAK6715313.1 putative Transcriptional regulator [Vibrio harveyi]
MSKLFFGEWTLDLNNQLLVNSGKRIPLTKRAFQVLVKLVKAEGELVTKEQLIEEVWQGIIVEENNLQAQISTIRRKLGSDRGLISTEFGKGYRFLGTLKASKNPKSVEKNVSIDVENIWNKKHSQSHHMLLGRETELINLSDLLEHNCLVTITGTAGVGKTCLAKELVQLLATNFRDGTKFVELAPIQEASYVSATILEPLGIYTGLDSLSDDDLSLLNSIQALLVLDNCEHHIEVLAEHVSVILDVAPNITILATSQEPLHTDGEHQYQLAPLLLPDSSSKKISDSPAVKLFCRQAEAIRYGFQPTEVQFQTIASICRKLDGLPLAIELAASRINMFSIDDIERSLDERLSYLTTGKRTSLPRHKTLKRAIDWTFQLLSDFEKQLFQHLSVFANKFDLSTIIELHQGFDINTWEIIEAVNGLIHKSLLNTSTDSGDVQFYMLESLKIFASIKLADSGEASTYKRAHAYLYRQQTEQASVDWIEMSSDKWELRHKSKINDLCLALDWAVIEKNDLHLGIQILKNTPAFWITLSMYDECRRYIEPILFVDYEPFKIDDHDIMHLNCALGKALTWSKGPTEETKNAWEVVLEIGQKITDTEAQLQAHYGLWLYCLRTNQFEAALRHGESFSAIAKSQSSDHDAIATGIRIEGVAKHYLGHHRVALDKLERSIQLLESYPSAQPFRFGLDQLVAARAFASRVFWVTGKTLVAMKAAHASLDRAYKLGHVCSICCSLAEGICMVATLNNDVKQVSELALELKQYSSGANLNLWTTYAELYITWVESCTLTPEEKCSSFTKKITSLSKDTLHWLYSTLIFESMVKAGMNELLKTPPFNEILNTEHWAQPIYFYHVTELASDESHDGFLQATQLALEVGAYSWHLKLQVYLAEKALTKKSSVDLSRLADALSKVDDNEAVEDVRIAKKILDK